MNYFKTDGPETPRLRKLVDFKGLKSKYGIPFSRTHLTNMENDKTFPKRVSIGANRISWVEYEIEAWLAAKIVARDGCKIASIARHSDTPHKLIDFKDLKATRGIAFCRTHLASLELEGKFPRRVHLSVSRVCWVLAEIDEWLAAKIASR